MIIRTVVVTPFAQNCRIVLDERRGAATVIDPGGDVDAIVAALAAAMLGGGPCAVEQIILTHAHIDHAGGVAELRDRLASAGGNPPLCAHRADALLRSSIPQQALMMGLSPAAFRACPEPDRHIDDGDVVDLSGLPAEVLFVPGHAPGHIALFVSSATSVRLQHMSPGGRAVAGEAVHTGPILFGGDTLFDGSIGRTDLPGGNHETLIASIRNKLLVLPDETRVLTGHGPDTSIGRERESNPFVGARFTAKGPGRQ